MPLKTQTVHLPLVRGLDTKKHKFAAEPPGLSVATNVEYDEVGGLAKREGSSSVSLTASDATTAIPLGVFEHAGEPVLVDKGAGNRFPSVLAGETLQIREADVDVGYRQYFNPCEVSVETTSVRSAGQAYSDQAITSSGWTLRAWTDYKNSWVDAAVFNADGVKVDTGFFPAATTSKPRCRAVGNYLHLYYYNSTANRVQVRIFDTTSPTSGFTTATAVYNAFGAVDEEYDVATDGTNTTWVVLVSTSTGFYGLQILSADGTQGTNRTVSRQSTGPGISIAYTSASSGLLLIGRAVADTRLDWVDSTTLADEADVNEQVDAAVFDSNIAVAATAGGLGFVIYDKSVVPSAGPTGNGFYRISVATHTLGDGATVVQDTYLTGYKLASRATAILQDGRYRVYFHAAYTGINRDGAGSYPDPTWTLQPHYLLLDANVFTTDDELPEHHTPGVVAKVLPGEAHFFVNDSGILTNQVDNRGHLPDLQNTSGVLSWCPMYIRSRIDISNSVPTRYEYGTKAITYTLSAATRCYSVEVNNVSYLPGGFLAEYDGEQVVENGFFSYPEQIIQDGEVTGLLTAGTYYYRFYWQWRNAQGQLERSTFGESVEVTVSGASKGPKFYIPTLGCSLKEAEEIQLVVFRTLKNQANTFYRCSSTDPTDSTYVTVGDTSESVYLTWEDTDFDENIGSSEPDTLFNTSALDTVQALAPQIISAGQYRLFYVGPEDDSRVRFSKLADYQETPGFNEALILQVPEQGGAIKAIEAGEDAIWIFKERAVYVASGDGPDNLGVGAYGQPRIISQDVGCSDPRSVIRVPQGIVFKSAKGFYLADRGFNIQYIGGAMDDQNSETVLAAVAEPEKHRCLFFTSTSVFLYDYLINEWADWTLEGESAALCGTTVYWVDSGVLKKQAPGVYTDSGSNYQFKIETDWIPLNGIAGFGRARRWALLGEYLSAFTLQCKVAYDRIESWIDSTDVDYTGTNPQTAGNRIHPRQRFSRQKTSALKFQVADENTDTGASFIFNGFSIEIGVKDGVVKTGESTITDNGGGMGVE